MDSTSNAEAERPAARPLPQLSLSARRRRRAARWSRGRNLDILRRIAAGAGARRTRRGAQPRGRAAVAARRARPVPRWPRAAHARSAARDARPRRHTTGGDCNESDPARRQHRSRRDAAPGAARELSRSAARGVDRRAGRAPTASRCTCARTAATSRITTCAASARRLQTRMNLEMAATDGDDRARPRAGAAGRLPGAGETRRRSRPRAGSTSPGRWQRCGTAACGCAAAGIRVSLFIDPDPAQLEAARRGRCAGRRTAHRCLCGSDGCAAGEGADADRRRRAASARRSGLTVHAGHGLHYHNVQPVAAIAEIVELNIGHAIVARAVIDGIAAAVREMRPLHDRARRGRPTLQLERPT